jgi:26S proteasome regulatory subunit N6
VTALIQGKMGAKYSGRQLEAMLAVAKAYQNRSLQEFETALTTYQQGGKDERQRFTSDPE